MKKSIQRMMGLAVGAMLAMNATAITPTRTVYLYPQGAPDSNGYTEADEEYTRERLFRTANPRLDIYMPPTTNSSSFVIRHSTLLCCPGGGYRFTSVVNEGVNVAEYFVPRGYVVAVLKYRLPNGYEQIPLEDAMRAMEILRDSAETWLLDPQKIGVIGFSAGGHLAASLVTKYNSPKSRPDYGILVYPVISSDSTIYHKGSFRELLGENPSAEQLKRWSIDKQVRPDMPPCLIVACQDDATVKVENSIRMYQAMTAAHVEASLVLVPEGKHGWGFARQFPNRELIEHAILGFIRTH